MNERLKELRGRARPKLSVREMAGKLGMSHPGYYFYERKGGFKQPYLPVDLATRIANILDQRGVDPDEVMTLAGVARRDFVPALHPSKDEQGEMAQLVSALPREHWVFFGREILKKMFGEQATWIARESSLLDQEDRDRVVDYIRLLRSARPTADAGDTVHDPQHTRGLEDRQ